MRLKRGKSGKRSTSEDFMPSDNYSPSPTNTSGGSFGNFNNPDLDREGKPKNKPIETALQAYQVYLRFKKQNRARANRNKIIADKYNGEPPYDPKDLEEQAQGWRSNVSTLFLASIIDRVTPRFTQAIHDIKYLTASELPDSYDDYVNKSEIFQARTTKLIREWSDWTDFIQRLATENVLNGYTCGVNMDEHNWRPRTFRQEEVYFDEQTMQTTNRLQCFAIEQDYFIHELVSLLAEPETTAKAGFNVDNLKSAIEYAMPPREDLPSDPRQLSDMAREGSLYFSWHRAAKMVQTVHVFVQDYDGAIDHWWVNRNSSVIGEPQPVGEDSQGGGGEELFYGEHVVPKMEDIITLFTFQSGNDRLFGSKGLGRMLVNISIAIERARNLYFDQQYMAGLLIGTAEEKDLPFLQPKVMSPFLIIPKGFELMAQQLQFNPETFAQLDAKLTAIAEVIAGTFLPEQMSTGQSPSGEQQTATEVTIEATKEQEIRQGILNRWWNQATRLVTQMQRRIYSPINIKAAIEYREARDEAAMTGLKIVNEETMKLLLEIDPAAEETYALAPELGRADEAAVNAIVDLLDAEMMPDEILVLAYTPATEWNANIGAIEDSKILQFAAVAQGNPYWDQGKLNFEAGSAMIGYRRAKDLFAGNPAMSTNLESQREQYGEFSDMLGGQAMPVSDRDDHIQHLQALNQKVFAMINTMRQIPPEVIPENDLNAMNLAITHGKAHVEAENKKPSGVKAGPRGRRTKQLQPLAQGVDAAEKAMNQILDARAQAQMKNALAGGQQPPHWTNPALQAPPGPPGIRPGGNAPSPGPSPVAPAQATRGAPASLPAAAAAPHPGLNPP
jgi:hypothetical protein